MICKFYKDNTLIHTSEELPRSWLCKEINGSVYRIKGYKIKFECVEYIVGDKIESLPRS